MAARNALLKYLRVNVNTLPQLQNPRPGSGGLSQLIRRHFSEEARGSFLDKSDVTDRVLNVVKTFQKVDPSKVVSADISRHGLAMYVAVKVDKIGQGTVLRATNANFKNSSSSITVTPTAHFQKDLGLDSLDTVEIVMALEEEFCFEIPDNEADKIHSINLAVDFIASHPQAK